MLVRDKLSNDKKVFAIKNNWRTRWNKLWERWCVFCHLRFSKRNLFAIDIANTGTDITQLPEFKNADIIHLAWVNQGFLSLNNIEKILNSGKTSYMDNARYMACYSNLPYNIRLSKI